jgi:hypothetical protein
VKLKIVAAVIAGLLVVGGGAFALTRLLNAPAEDAAVSYVPEDAIGYANFFIRPSTSQRRALDAILRRIPGIETTDDVIDRFVELLDEALAQEDLSYEEDVEPWLGDQVAAFMVGGGSVELPNFAVLIESKDDGALEDFVDALAAQSDVELEEKTYEGASYRMQEGGEDGVAVGVVEGFLVGGTEDAFKAAVDAHASGETIETEDDFADATEPLNEDWIGLFYLDTADFISEFAQTQGFGPNEQAAFDALGFDEQEPQAAILYATNDSVVFESTGGFNPTGRFGELAETITEPGLVPDLPAETWAAYGIPSFGGFFDGIFETFQNVPGFDRRQVDALFYGQTGLRLQEDVLSWMEDAGFFVQGTSIQGIGGGLVIESNDPAKTDRLLAKLQDLVTQQGIRTRPESRGDLEGFSVTIPGVPAPVYALGGDRLVIAYGDEAAEAAAGEGERLRDSEAFAAAQDAVGEDFNVSFFVDVDAAQRFGEAAATFAGAPMDVYEREVKPYVDVLTHVVGAARMEGDRIVQKIVIGVE